jgi:hypothetical protein
VKISFEDWKNGWHGIELGLSAAEIDQLIGNLEMLKQDTEQHFHISSDYKGDGGVGDITIYVKNPSDGDNASMSGRALAPDEDIGEIDTQPRE